jgi:peptidoglycan hydrolase-like protein with peptidoglycan-binding domain
VRLVNWTSQAHLNPERCCSVVIDHDDGWQSSYLHLNNDTPGTDDGAAWGIADGVVPGFRVEQGQLLGWVGDSQSAEDTAAHLHFELRDTTGTLVNSYAALVTAGGNATDDGISDPAFDGTYAIREGDEGLHVRRLQEVLVGIGYEIGVDGDFGPATLAAVLGFQEDAGLTADGLFGRLSKQSLAAAYGEAGLPGDGVVTSTLRRGSRGDEVRLLQQALNREGHNTGGSDGIFGGMTEAAVILYQRALGLSVDGIAGPQTLRSLRLQ